MPDAVARVLQNPSPRKGEMPILMAANFSPYQVTRCHRFGWTLERIGWGFMAATMLAAVVGVFGDGWLSVAETRGPGGAAVRYPRFGRAHSPLVLKVEWTVGPRVAAVPDPVLWIDRAYLDDFAIEEVRPPPVAVTLDSERIQYSFRVSEPNVRAAVEFTLRANHGGIFSGSLGFGEEPGLTVRQYVFP